MGNLIKYKKGQALGPHGCIYLHDKKLTPIRSALFKCGLCGKIFESRLYNIKSGSTKSCGCAMLKHGLKGHPLYGVWGGIKTRCYNKNAINYKYYGYLGIRVCDEWMHDFKVFYDYMMSLPHAMEEGYTIDRKKSRDDYKPGNVKWSTRHEQAVNSKRKITNKSGYIGVYAIGNNRYQAAITVNYKTKKIGAYSTPKEAVTARNRYIERNNLNEYKIQ